MSSRKPHNKQTKVPKMITISMDTLTSVNIYLADKQGTSFSQMVEDSLKEKLVRDTEVQHG